MFYWSLDEDDAILAAGFSDPATFIRFRHKDTLNKLTFSFPFYYQMSVKYLPDQIR